MCIQEEGGRVKKDGNDSEREELTEEQLQYSKQHLCTPHGPLSPLSLAMAMPEHRSTHA